ncbi:MAG TPA: hypothetical protein VL503_04585, partial [Candidatus Omnitrophota bacterium]|nr:hypothetical protein [Candidatus Omnitrophota bacterium]
MSRPDRRTPLLSEPARSGFLAAASLLLLLTPGSGVRAQIPSESSATPLPAPAPIVESVTPTGYRVRVPIGDAQTFRARVAGYDLTEIRIPGGVDGGAWGQPSLPTRTVLLRIPWGSIPVARGAWSTFRSLGSLEPVPVPHLVTEAKVRDRVAPEAVAAAMQGAPYRALGGGGEAAAIAGTALMAARGERYLAVTLRPVTWDPATREARVAEAIVVDVSWAAPAGARPSGGAATAA